MQLFEPYQFKTFEYSRDEEVIGRGFQIGVTLAPLAVAPVLATEGGLSISSKNPFNNCFVAGTLIHTENGLVPIETIKAGDRVLSYNEDSRQVEYQDVVRLFRNTADEFLKIQVEGEAEPITVTLGRPFYVQRTRNDLSNDEANGDWVLSKSLRVGDLLRDKTGAWKSILSIEKIERKDGTCDRRAKMSLFETDSKVIYWLKIDFCLLRI